MKKWIISLIFLCSISYADNIKTLVDNGAVRKSDYNIFVTSVNQSINNISTGSSVNNTNISNSTTSLQNQINLLNTNTGYIVNTVIPLKASINNPNFTGIVTIDSFTANFGIVYNLELSTLSYSIQYGTNTQSDYYDSFHNSKMTFLKSIDMNGNNLQNALNIQNDTSTLRTDLSNLAVSTGIVTTHTVQLTQLAIDTTTINTRVTNVSNGVGTSTQTLRTDLTAVSLATGTINSDLQTSKIAIGNSTGTLRIDLSNIAISTGNLVLKSGDTMTGTLYGTSATFSGNGNFSNGFFTVGDSTFMVKAGAVGIFIDPTINNTWTGGTGGTDSDYALDLNGALRIDGYNTINFYELGVGNILNSSIGCINNTSNNGLIVQAQNKKALYLGANNIRYMIISSTGGKIGMSNTNFAGIPSSQLDIVGGSITIRGANAGLNVNNKMTIGADGVIYGSTIAALPGTNLNFRGNRFTIADGSGTFTGLQVNGDMIVNNSTISFQNGLFKMTGDNVNWSDGIVIASTTNNGYTVGMGMYPTQGINQGFNLNLKDGLYVKNGLIELDDAGTYLFYMQENARTFAMNNLGGNNMKINCGFGGSYMMFSSTNGNIGINSPVPSSLFAVHNGSISVNGTNAGIHSEGICVFDSTVTVGGLNGVFLNQDGNNSGAYLMWISTGITSIPASETNNISLKNCSKIYNIMVSDTNPGLTTNFRYNVFTTSFGVTNSDVSNALSIRWTAWGSK